MRNLWTVNVCLAAACVLAQGCRGNDVPETLPVSGTVTLDGKPVEGVSVGFYPKSGGRPAMGRTDTHGRYTLSTFASQDGAVPGGHSVVVSKVAVRRPAGAKTDAESESDQMGNPAFERARTEYLIPQKYSMPMQSGLTAEVTPDCGAIDFALKSK